MFNTALTIIVSIALGMVLGAVLLFFWLFPRGTWL